MQPGCYPVEKLVFRQSQRSRREPLLERQSGGLNVPCVADKEDGDGADAGVRADNRTDFPNPDIFKVEPFPDKFRNEFGVFEAG